MKRLYRDSRGMLWFLFYFVASTTVLFYSFRAIENYYKNPPLDPTDVPLLAWLPMVFICVGWWEIGVWFMRKVMGNEASPGGLGRGASRLLAAFGLPFEQRPDRP